MPGAEWLGLLCKHIPDRYEHLVRYCGWYSWPATRRAGSPVSRCWWTRDCSSPAQ